MTDLARKPPVVFSINRFLAPRLLEAWTRIRFDGEVADRCLAQISKRDRLGGRDRRRLAEAVFSALRSRGLVDATLSASAQQREHAPTWLNTALQQRAFDGAMLPLPPPGNCPIRDGNLPPELVEQRRQLEGDDSLLALGLAMRQRAPVTLRVFGAKRGDVQRHLATAGLTSSPCQFAATGLVVDDGRALKALADDPRFTVQDEGSQLLATMAAVRPGLRVLDACAGAGGKTLALLDAGATVVAADVSPARLRRLADRCRQHRFDAPKCVALPTDGPFPDLGLFDLVLVDAPCTGSGTGRRAPDLLWRFNRQRCAEFVALQEAILDRAAEAVRPGGRLLYGTCSLSPLENEGQAERFLERQPTFRALPAAAGLGTELATKLGAEHWMSLRPDRHGTDGFFGALFERS